jgi:hypothetical protein
MKKTLLALLLLTGGSAFAATRVAIGVGVGTPYGYYAPPPCPGPDYTWVEGYWDTAGPHRDWRGGHWAPPVRVRNYRAAPRYDYRYHNTFRHR